MLAVGTTGSGCASVTCLGQQSVAVFVMADRLAEPGRRHVFRMLVGEVDATHQVVALPDHPHFLRRLDEIDGLERPQKLARNASRIASRLRRKGNVAHALQYLVISRLNLLCPPRL